MEVTPGAVEAVGAALPVRRAATLVIAAAALVTAAAGYLAARADARVAVAQRARAVQTATALRELHHLSLESADITDAGTRAIAAQAHVGAIDERFERAGAAERPGLRRGRAYWTAAAGQAAAADPAAVARGYGPAVTAEQQAAAQAEVAERWAAREDTNLGIAGFSAVAVLLVATSLASPARRPYRFLLLAACVAGYGGLRLAYVNRHDPEGLPPAAVEAYARGAVRQQLREPAAAAAEFVAAVAAAPGYAAAWRALGDTNLSDVDARTARWAAEAYERAVALGGSDGTLLNNLAYAELLSGDLDDAARHAAAARALLPDDPSAEATAAEVLVARGDRRAALAAADALVARLARERPTFREHVFSALRDDQADLAAVGIAGPAAEAFYGRLRQAAATLEAYGTATPRGTGGTTATVTVAYDPGALTMTYAVRCEGVRRDTRVGLRVYAGTGLVASAVHGRRGRGCPASGALPVDPGAYTVEVYVNGTADGTERYVFGR